MQATRCKRAMQLVACLCLSTCLVVHCDPSCFDGSDGFPLPLLYDAMHKPLCPPGFVCPGFDVDNASTFPQFCPPSIECMIHRTQGELCEGSNGLFEPYLCPQGMYCPNATTLVQCPSNYYCPYGQQQPLRCPALSYCPAGSTGPTTFPSLVAFGLVLPMLAIALTYYRRKIVPSRLPHSYSCEGAPPITDTLHELSLPVTSDMVLTRYFTKSRSRLAPLTISFRDLSVTRVVGSTHATMLTAVSGTLRPGTVTAILGPSGCGKSVLLRTLLGRTESTWTLSGALTINGEANLEKYRSVVGSVPQDDVLHTELTTFRNIMHSAELRLPQSWMPAERADLIKAVLEELGIAHVADVPIGNAESRGVSGGQRKRASIGVELVAAPLALLLDEPTKGLDSNTALELVQTLSHIARETNLTVAMVINQPRTEIWRALDEVLILGPGGTTVFQGPRAQVAQYMTTAFGTKFPQDSNPADVILDQITVSGERMARAWSKKQSVVMTGQTTVDTRQTSTANSDHKLADFPSWRGATFLQQTYRFHLLYIEKQLNATSSFTVEMGVALFLGLMLGYSLSQFTPLGSFRYPFEMISPSPLTTLPPQMHMYALMSLGLATATSGVNAFVNDKATFARAAACGCSTIAFYVGTVSASWYRLIPVTLAFATPYHILSKSSCAFFPFFSIFFLFSFAMYAVAAIVALVADQRSSPLVAGVLAIVYSCFSGFIDFPTPLKKLSFCFWAAQALQQWMFADTQVVFGDMLSAWDWTIDNTSASFGVIAAMGVVYHAVGLVILVTQSRPRHATRSSSEETVGDVSPPHHFQNEDTCLVMPVNPETLFDSLLDDDCDAVDELLFRVPSLPSHEDNTVGDNTWGGQASKNNIDQLLDL